MLGHSEMNAATTLALPYPRLVEGRFGSCTVLTDESLHEACGVRIAFTERTGGVSEGAYASLNLGRHVDDDPERVRRNVSRVLDAFGASEDVCIRPRQVHGNTVAVCRSAKEASAVNASTQDGADGVVVACDNVSTLLCFADCAPLIMVAPSGHFAVVHAGWRGVVARIAEGAVRTLREIDRVSADQVNVYIGPHIGVCHFEVGTEVSEVFSCEFGEDCVPDPRHVDLSRALRNSLCGVGVDESRIVDAGICTVCDEGRRFFSYRASGGVCGRHGAFAIKTTPCS